MGDTSCRTGCRVAAGSSVPSRSIRDRSACLPLRRGGRQSAGALPSPNSLSTASTPPAHRKRKVLPMCPVRSVTYVSGRSQKNRLIVVDSRQMQRGDLASRDREVLALKTGKIDGLGEGIVRFQRTL